jgi:hypothetical protein
MPELINHSSQVTPFFNSFLLITPLYPTSCQPATHIPVCIGVCVLGGCMDVGGGKAPGARVGGRLGPGDPGLAGATGRMALGGGMPGGGGRQPAWCEITFLNLARFIYSLK